MGQRLWWSVVVTLRVRLQSFFPGSRERYIYWFAAMIFTRTCLPILPGASSRHQTSRFFLTLLFGRCTATHTCAQSMSSITRRERCERLRLLHCSVLSVHRRTPTGYHRKLRKTKSSSYAPAQTSRGRPNGSLGGNHTCWRPAVQASLPPEMFGPARSSAAPQRSAK